MKKRVLIVLLCFVGALSSAFAAEKKVQGVVISSEDNLPLIGASVYVTAEDLKKAGSAQTTMGVITDVDGQFSIAIPAGITRFFCSYVGYDVLEVKLVPGKEHYEITLHASSQMLDAVVVTGYQTVERRKLTAAVSKLDISDETIGAVKSIDQALAGQIAGLSVSPTSGAPGAPAKIRIRGTASLNGTQDPLWVLDGIPLEGTDVPEPDELNDITNMKQSSIAGLNPADIENITILKDAAANGVIVITTKKGKVGKPVINFSSRFTYTPTLSLDRLNLLNSAEKVGLEMDMIRNNYSPDNHKGGVYNILSNYNELSAFQNGGWDALSSDTQAAINRLKSVNTNWGDILFRDAFSQEYNLSLSGGTERVTYYTSFGYYKEDGNVDGVGMDRFNLVGKTSYKVNSILKVGASMFANRRKNTNYLTDAYGMSNPVFYSRKANPYFELYDKNGNYNYDYDIQNNTDKDLGFNIFEERQNTSNESVVNSFSSIFDAELRFNDKWKLTSQFGYQLEKTSREEIADWESYAMRYYYKLSEYSQGGETKHFLPEGGMQKSYENSNSQITWKAMGEYRDSFNDIHELEVMAGTELRKTWYETLFSAGYGFDRKTLTTKPVIFPNESYATSFPLHQTTYKENAYVSFYSTASYSLLNRYTVGGSIRFDGSDLFGVDKKYRYLPLYSVSALWRLSQEPFMQQAKWVDNLVFRASYGLQGNIDKNTSPFLLGTYRSESILPGVSEDVIIINSAPNKKLRWEKTQSVNAGFDFSVLNQAINLSVDYYYRKGTDLIALRMLPLETGFTSMNVNWASMENKGVEISLSTRNITTKNFSWYTNFNFAYNGNKVLQENIPEQQTTPGREGYPVGAIFALKTAGVNKETGNMMFYNPEGEKVTLKELYRLKDEWGIGIASSDVTAAEERTFYSYIGSSDAPYTGGLINTFSYKNWELNVNFSLTFGGYVRTQPSYDIINPDYGKNYNADVLNRWTPENPNAELPAFMLSASNPEEYSWYDSKTIWRDLDIWVKKLNYVRLQNLRLGYRIPELLTKRLGMNSATVSIEGRNLFVFGSGYNNYMDPESMYNPYATPVPKSVTFSLNLNF
ncbi:SusC/RagA family TonB-linked outer membrane protein [Bacteroides uniformis]|uniref:SusC/RagA family TonB-linked outer membrane protein n=1 Tax=Bacteroides uniformis TaxID=820 RepID=UPI001C37AF3A|nr:SusC/RagA family TonB-linked outer membrane protein [Bacteroides uniformis]MBV3827678.1 SusC/RagA family TonB-linked outer membrane protein [Bacteroides uniformis]